jgi:hypothetical protein
MRALNAPGLGVPSQTRSLALDLAVSFSALGAVVAMNVILVHLIVGIQKVCRQGLHAVILGVCRACGQRNYARRSAGYGSAPGCMESSSAVPFLWCRRCMYRRRKESLFSVLIHNIVGRDLGGGSGGDFIGRERKDSNVSAPDVEVNAKHDLVYRSAAAEVGGGDGIEHRTVAGSSTAPLDPDLFHKSLAEGSSSGSAISQRYAVLTYPCRMAMQGTSAVLYSILFLLQLGIMLGVLVFSPLLILVCATVFLLVFSAASYPDPAAGEYDEDHGSGGPIMENTSILSQAGSAIVVGEGEGRGAPPPSPRHSLLFAMVDEEDMGMAYVLTCVQFYLSILALRVPGILVAFLRFNPDKYLNSHFDYLDSLVVIPFVAHIVLLLRTPGLANGTWLLVPAMLGALTAVSGVVLLDRSPHLIPALNVVFVGALSLAHLRACIGWQERMRFFKSLGGYQQYASRRRVGSGDGRKREVVAAAATSSSLSPENVESQRLRRR